ncbi:MAG: efflux RND transporter periplasmic adaptor subunit [Planctomycetota bacterium]|nr:efflux RND transporter periplasmic adaptor subunit [Planctomycetota bacterium]MDA1106274.1 efflux RND transporter periplasmic adaptor subunit [Planctomycetota bacterium]
MPRPVKIVLVVLGIAFAIVVVGGQDLWSLMPSFGSGTARQVRVEPVGIKEVVERVSSPGLVEPVTKVDISAEVSERVVELPFREGDLVKKGDVVVRLDDRDLRARMESASARRNSAKSRLESEEAGLGGPRATATAARKSLERQKSLYESGDISRQQLDDAISSAAGAEANLARSEKGIVTLENEIAASEADYARSQRDLERCIIQSPIDGVLVKLNAEQGELVMVGTMNNAGTVILTVADLTNMRLVAEVNEADIARIQVGQPAEVRINAYKGEVFTGEVDEVSLQREGTLQNQSADQSGIFQVRIGLDLEGGRQILSGLVANVEVELARHTGLAVPSQAVVDKKADDLPASLRDNPLRDPGAPTVAIVFLEVDGKATARVVKTGPSSLTETIILEGITEGDRVVTGPFKQLEVLKEGDTLEEIKDGWGGEEDGKKEGMEFRMDGGGGGRRHR